MSSPCSPPPGGEGNTDGGTQGAEVRSGEVAAPGDGWSDAITPSEGLPAKTAPHAGGR
uniref:Uncharacterized protein n=1 Tax=Peronospora matthiolae TaxID=2874970 RepID=A0AAV1TNM1_9STRA